MKFIAIFTSLLILFAGIILGNSKSNCHERRLTSNGQYSVNLAQCIKSSGETQGSLTLLDTKGDTMDLIHFKGTDDNYNFKFSWTAQRALTISYEDSQQKLQIAQPDINVFSDQISVRLIKRETMASRFDQSVSSK